MSKIDYFDEIEVEITRLKQCELNLTQEISELSAKYEKTLDSLCSDLLSVIDAFNKADKRLIEQSPDNKDVDNARKRYATAKNKLRDILSKFNVQIIEFPDGKAILEYCQIVDTEPDPEKENDTIIAIEKDGYKRNGRLLRVAEVIVVRN